MSIDIDWHRLTNGPEGVELAESVRDFIHDKFQQVELPRFIRSVQVHSFDFGDECPSVEIKDFTDPWPEFYEDEETSSEEADEEDSGDKMKPPAQRPVQGDGQREKRDTRLSEEPPRYSEASLDGSMARPPPSRAPKPSLIGSIPTLSNTRPMYPFSPYPETPFLSGSNTPGIPGGTSNLSYFHLPLSSGLRSGTQTPLAAAFGPGSVDLAAHPEASRMYREEKERTTAIDDEDEAEDTHDERANDLQTTLHTTYNGNLSLSLTAEILLDYPMPSFVGIPLALKITGLSFDGVGLLAYMRPRKRKEGSRRGSVDSEESKGRCHFCFLAPEDARLVVGDEGATKDGQDQKVLGGLLKEIRVETEIGRQENGKQVLKNVDKVEKFVLEQVRRIFEEEFVWPSFWTFLV